ncbi:hypothetical protein AB9M75_10810 [Lactobacillus sp. AN1001]
MISTLNDYYAETTEELEKVSAVEAILRLPIAQAIRVVKKIEASCGISTKLRFSLSATRQQYLDNIQDDAHFEGKIDREAFRNFLYGDCLFGRLMDIDTNILEKSVLELI